MTTSREATLWQLVAALKAPEVSDLEAHPEFQRIKSVLRKPSAQVAAELREAIYRYLLLRRAMLHGEDPLVRFELDFIAARNRLDSSMRAVPPSFFRDLAEVYPSGRLLDAALDGFTPTKKADPGTTTQTRGRARRVRPQRADRTAA